MKINKLISKFFKLKSNNIFINEVKKIVKQNNNINIDLVIKNDNLKDIQSYLDMIPCINSGGCGISALSLYQWLINNNVKEKIQFIYLYRDRDYNFSNNDKILSNKRSKKTLQAPSHVMLNIGKYFIDSTGSYITLDKEYYKEMHININKMQLINCIKSAPNWNEFFNRYTNVPKIEKLLSIDLSEIK